MATEGDFVKKIFYLAIFHPNAAVRGSLSNLVLLMGAVNVDVALFRVDAQIALVYPQIFTPFQPI